MIAIHYSSGPFEKKTEADSQWTIEILKQKILKELGVLPNQEHFTPVIYIDNEWKIPDLESQIGSFARSTLLIKLLTHQTLLVVLGELEDCILAILQSVFEFHLSEEQKEFSHTNRLIQIGLGEIRSLIFCKPSDKSELFLILEKYLATERVLNIVFFCHSLSARDIVLSNDVIPIIALRDLKRTVTTVLSDQIRCYSVDPNVFRLLLELDQPSEAVDNYFMEYGSAETAVNSAITDLISCTRNFISIPNASKRWDGTPTENMVLSKWKWPHSNENGLIGESYHFAVLVSLNSCLADKLLKPKNNCFEGTCTEVEYEFFQSVMECSKVSKSFEDLPESDQMKLASFREKCSKLDRFGHHIGLTY
jgi:hypothetical protein